MLGSILVFLGLRPAPKYRPGDVLEYKVNTPEWRYFSVIRAVYQAPPGQVEKIWCYHGLVFYVRDGILHANGHFRYETEDKFRPVNRRHDGQRFECPVLTSSLPGLAQAVIAKL